MKRTKTRAVGPFILVYHRTWGHSRTRREREEWKTRTAVLYTVQLLEEPKRIQASHQWGTTNNSNMYPHTETVGLDWLGNGHWAMVYDLEDLTKERKLGVAGCYSTDDSIQRLSELMEYQAWIEHPKLLMFRIETWMVRSTFRYTPPIAINERDEGETAII